MKAQFPEETLTLSVTECVLAKKSNFFLALALDAACSSDNGKTVRTDVQRGTRHPKFSACTWCFKLPLMETSPRGTLVLGLRVENNVLYF